MPRKNLNVLFKHRYLLFLALLNACESMENFVVYISSFHWDYKVARVMKLDNGWLNWQMDTLCHQPGFNFKIRNFINLLVLALYIK